MVLVDFRWKDYIEAFHFPDEVKEAVIKATVLSDEWNEFDRSVLTDEEMIDSFVKNAPDYEREIRKVIENIGDAIVTFDYAKPWINELKDKGYRVYILSNYARKTYELTRKQLDFVNDCDGAVFSFQVNKIKPEEEIFHILAKRYQFKPCEAVFIDDNINNIEAANGLGFHTIHFTTREKAVEELAKICHEC